MNEAAAGEGFLTSRAGRVTLVMSCLYSVLGVLSLFMQSWLAGARGLSGSEIGVLLSLPQFARIVVGSGIAFWADGHADRRMPLRVIAPLSFAAFFTFFFVAQGFVALLIVGFVAMTLNSALTPLIESAALRATATGRVNYGFVRGIGSLSFIVANVAGGMLVSRFGLGAVVAWILSTLALSSASAWLALKPDPPLSQPHMLSRQARVDAFSALMRNRRFIILILACGFIQAAHGFYYGFSALVWARQGIPPDIVGLLWGVGVTVEVFFLWNLRLFERRLTPEALILIAAIGGTLRWALLGFGPAGALLWLLQALHAFSFAAAHVGAMRLLARETPENAAAMAQTLYSAVSGGLLMGGASMLSGVLYDHIGAGGYWAMAGMSFIGGLLALGLFTPPQRISLSR